MYADPVTWTVQERIAHYREQADTFEELAKSDDRPVARRILIQLSSEFNSLADGLQELP